MSINMPSAAPMFNPHGPDKHGGAASSRPHPVGNRRDKVRKQVIVSNLWRQADRHVNRFLASEIMRQLGSRQVLTLQRLEALHDLKL